MHDIIYSYTENNVTIKYLSEKYGYKNNIIVEELKKYGIIVKHGREIYISEVKEKLIIDLYKNKNYNVKDIAKKLKFKDGRIICRILKKNNINIFPANGYSKKITVKILSEIQEYINNTNNIKIIDISKHFNLSDVTIRNYIKKGCLIFEQHK